MRRLLRRSPATQRGEHIKELAEPARQKNGNLCTTVLYKDLSSVLAGNKVPIKIVSYSATELDPKCRSVLLSHSGEHQPEHVFGDTMDRLPRSL